MSNENKTILLQTEESRLNAGYYDRNAFRNKGHLLLVLQTGVAGMQFHVDKNSPEGRELLDKLVPGTELMLYRDTDNEHDKWAISVTTKDDKELGYITRFKNETVARLMDLGKKFYAYVDTPPEPPKDETERRRTHTPTENYEIPFSVYMEDN